MYFVAVSVTSVSELLKSYKKISLFSTLNCSICMPGHCFLLLVELGIN